MSSTQVDPEQVITRLSQQIGLLSAQMAMRDVALEAAQARISELEATQPEPAAD